MKNIDTINNSTVPIAQTRVNCCNTAVTRTHICMHSHTYINQHSYNHLVQSASSAITVLVLQNLKSNFIDNRGRGPGSKPGENFPTACSLIGITY